MEGVIRVLEDTFNQSFIEDLKHYIQENSVRDKWLMFSDYCIGAEGKPNDVISFTIMPYDNYPQIIQNTIFSLAPTDIKDKRNVNPDFITYLKEKRLFHVNFFLESRKGLTQVDGKTEKEVVKLILDSTNRLLDQWCENTPNNAKYFREVKKKIGIIQNELSKKSANYGLFRDVILVSLLAGYLSFLFTKFNSAKVFSWFSDRDKIITAYNMIAADLFHINHHSLCGRDSIDSSITKIVFGVPKPDEDGKVWYDDMNRLPDHIAGTLADYNTENNTSTKSKFINMLEGCIADNPYLAIFRLNLEPNLFRCTRVQVFKNTH